MKKVTNLYFLAYLIVDKDFPKIWHYTQPIPLGLRFHFEIQACTFRVSNPIFIQKILKNNVQSLRYRQKDW